MSSHTTLQEPTQDERRFRSAMASSGVGMAIVDLKGRWLEVNPAFERMFGFSAAEVIGREVVEMAHPDDAETSRIHLQGMTGENPPGADAESRYLRRDGSTLWAQANVGVMRDDTGRPQSLIVQLRDITTQRAATDALRESNRALEQCAGACSADLEVANHQLDVFASGISHDLRAPLRTIESFGKLLDKSADDRLQSTEKDYLQRMLRATGRMGRLIDGLVELSRVTTAELKPESVDLGLLAEWVVAELQEEDPDRPLDFAVMPGLMAHGDMRLLKTLMSHLLRNAWTFSRERAVVFIRAEGETAEDGLHFAIHDRGRGIDMRYADKLFQPFQRQHGEDLGAGHGLGLAIVQRIAQRHGGRVWVESAVDAGSVFHVQLPDAARTEASASNAGRDKDHR